MDLIWRYDEIPPPTESHIPWCKKLLAISPTDPWSNVGVSENWVYRYTMENPPNNKNKNCASFQQET